MVSECMFIYGQQEELLRIDNINVQILERIFNVEPTRVWLRKEQTSRIYMPDISGHFHIANFEVNAETKIYVQGVRCEPTGTLKKRKHVTEYNIPDDDNVVQLKKIKEDISDIKQKIQLLMKDVPNKHSM